MNKFKASAATLILIILVLILTGCNANDGIKYNSKMTTADEYAFDLVYTASDQKEPIYVNCYMRKGDYAYRFCLVEYNFSKLAYRQIYTKDGTFYEICEMQSSFVWTGEYRVTYNVKADDERNFIYKYTQMITKGGYATMFNKPQKISYRDMTCKQYNFTYEDMDLTYIFDPDTSLLLKFVMVKGGDVKTLEYYNYQFEYVDSDCIYPPTMFGINNGHLGIYKQTDELIYEYFID